MPSGDAGHKSATAQLGCNAGDAAGEKAAVEVACRPAPMPTEPTDDHDQEPGQAPPWSVPLPHLIACGTPPLPVGPGE